MVKDRKEKLKIIIDEPEIHLHPKALLSFIKELISYKCEIWIATHSLYLLAEFNFDEITFISKGNIQKRNSKLYYSIFEEMLGFGNPNTFQMFSSLDNWQYYNFIFECFFHPRTVKSVNFADPQFDMFIRSIEEKEQVSVLDWGGGSGRIGKILEEYKKVNSCPIVTYSIYDPYPDVFDLPSVNVFDNVNNIGGKYDCIILMNVLHEVPLSEWKDTFEKIYSFLNQDGQLIFIEVVSLSHGELPSDKNGFIIMGYEQLKILFNDSTSEIAEVRFK